MQTARFASFPFSFWIVGVCFLSSLLYVNRDLFRTPVWEDGDFAISSLQVQEAKKLHELVGNRSRWHFSHPGPAFLYICAGAEYLLYDLLHVVPAPMNAQLVAVLLLNSLFIFGTLAIFGEFCPSPLFLPLATMLLILFIYAVNRTIPSGALLSSWPPHLLLFNFLFFVTACGAVAVGRIAYLPLMMATGLLLVHIHIAQVLFVSLLATLALGVLTLSLRKSGQMRTQIRAHRKALVGSALILCLFALPIVVDLVRDKPNNLRRIRSYAHEHKGQQKSMRVSLRYYTSFLAFNPHPDVELPRPRFAVASMASRPYALAYWAICLLLASAAVVLQYRSEIPVSPFIRYILLEIALISVLFIYWGTRIAGEMYNFNGFFIYSIQLLSLLAIASTLTINIAGKALAGAAVVSACFVTLLLVPLREQFVHIYAGDPKVPLIASTVSTPDDAPTRIEFEVRDWPLAAGVANLLERRHRQFCVEPLWTFLFGYDKSCAVQEQGPTLMINHDAVPVSASSRLLFQQNDLFVWFLPVGASSATAAR